LANQKIDKVHIIGISPQGISCLDDDTRKIIESAEMLFGGEKLLLLFPGLKCEKIAIKHNLDEISDLIKSNLGKKRIAVLASGDPSCFGIARFIIGHLGKDAVEIIPAVSSMQLAFARIKENWDNAAIVSVHSRPVEDIIETIRRSKKTGIFTDTKNMPDSIARVLLDRGIDGYTAYVCQDLGNKSEKIFRTDLKGLTEMRFSYPNILILIKNEDSKKASIPGQSIGIPDKEFFSRSSQEGFITKQEVRAVSLAKLRIADGDVIWDIGAGTGAVSIEASFLCGSGRVYAVEKNPGDAEIIRKNVDKFQASGVEIVGASAPDNLDTLPEPDAVFIGGSGGRIKEILEYCGKRLKKGGRIVINIVALENLQAAVNTLKDQGFTCEVVEVSVSRSISMARYTRLEPLNPVFIVTGTRQGKQEK